MAALIHQLAQPDSGVLDVGVLITPGPGLRREHPAPVHVNEVPVRILPEHRGNGYIDEILAEGTRTLAAQDVTRIPAATDLGNTPMANAFQRAGYVNFERTINMTWQ